MMVYSKLRRVFFYTEQGKTHSLHSKANKG